MANYDPAQKAVLDDMLLGHPAVRAGKMFGYPAYYVGTRLCISLYENGVGLKLPEATVQRLLASDPAITPFQPMGRRRMREWVQITLDNAEDYRRYDAVFDEAIRYLLTQP